MYMLKFCSSPYNTVAIHADASVSSCLCAGWHKYGSNMGNLNQNSLTEIFANHHFKNFRSSILDQSFKYCIKEECAKMWNLDQISDISAIDNYPKLPTKMNVQIEKNCNLKCASCRNEVIWSKEINPQVEKILSTLVQDYQDFNEKVWFQCDGFGDIFASRAYQNFFRRDDLPKCFDFNLTTNGNLITKNLDLIEKLKPQIFSLCVSFDSANEQTYKEIRGGKFDLILDGVRECVKMGVTRVNASFVTQKKNYLEILDYYNLCKSLGISHIGISKIDRWWHMSDAWWQENQIDDNPTVDYKFLVSALKTIKNDPDVGMCGGLENLIATKSILS